MTVPAVRELMAVLLWGRASEVGEIAEKVSRVLRRNEEARIYHWYSRKQQFPPRRTKPDG
jgi:hypothetical protein